MEHPIIHLSRGYALCRLASFALRFSCAQGRWLTDLLDESEANRFSASAAWWKPIACSHQDFVRHSMPAVAHLINAALAAECTGKKIVSGTDAFHWTYSLNLPPVEVGRLRAAVRS